MQPHLIIFAVEIMAITGSLIVGTRMLLWHPNNFSARLLAFICFNSVCAVLLSRQDYGFWIPEALQVDYGGLAIFMNIARNLTAGLFMIFCHSLFQEQKTFPRWLLVLYAFQVLMEEPIPWLLVPSGAEEPFLYELIPSLLQLLFVGFALWWTVQNWEADMVETRRRLRWFILITVGLQIVLIVALSRLVLPAGEVSNFYTNVASNGLIAFLNFFVILALYGAYESDIFGVARTSAPQLETAPRSYAEVDIARFNDTFYGKHLYREPGLTIASLAGKLSMPEYRLRKLIHEHLGYRNFNALLHEHRIKEACEQLADPEKAKIPILTIALSVGYQSINPFNRAFKEQIGMTPSAYRTDPKNGIEPGQNSVPSPQKKITDS